MQYKHLNNKFGSILKVDIDRKKISFFTFKSIQLLSRNFTLQKLIIKRSPSKKGWHIVLCIKEQMTDSEIIAWQFALNSDRKRERYNLLRHTHGNTMKDWNILFEKKVKRKISFQDRMFAYSELIGNNRLKIKDYLCSVSKEKEIDKIYQEDFDDDEFDYTHR